MRKPHACAAAGLVLILAVLTGIPGCGSKAGPPPPTPTISRFTLTHHVGGTHYRVLQHEGRFLLAFACSVQVVDPRSLAVINDVPLGEFGRCGPVIDLAITGNRLFAVVEDDAVVEMSLAAGAPPAIERQTTSDVLGILPRRLSVVDGRVYVSGLGGVYDLAAGKRIFSSESECGSVARGADGLLVSVGRRVLRISDGGFVGAASEIVNLPAETASSDSAALAFALAGQQAGTAGLMNDQVREVASVLMPESVTRVRVIGDQLFVVGSSRVDWYTIKGHELESVGSAAILGATDVWRIDSQRLLIVGTAGRALYQEGARPGEQGTFTAAQREPSRLTYATGDGLNVLAGSREGAWMYLVNAHAELTRKTLDSAPPGPRSASTVNARAEITPDGTAIKIAPIDDAAGAAAMEYREPKGAKMRTVVAVGGDFWIGHDRGITILSGMPLAAKLPGERSSSSRNQPRPLAAAQPESLVKQRLRIPGPVLYIFPMLAGRGASYVSEFGGFGAARFINEVQ